MFIGRTDAEAETHTLAASCEVDSLEKTLMLGGIGAGGEGDTEDEIAGWHHRLDGHEFE